MERESEYHSAEEDVPLSGRIWLFHFYLHAGQAFLRFLDGYIYGKYVGAALGGLYPGVQNIFDSYQDDFDKGAHRDAGYIYGPGIPRSYFVGCKISY